MDRSSGHIRRWYALYVNVRHEKSIGVKLTQKGIESYVPVIKQLHNWSDRKKLVEVPLITGYVFVCLTPQEMDKPIYVPGVINYVRFQEKPAVITAEEIEGLKFFVENGFSIEEPGEEDLRVGDVVRFNLSEFKSFVGVIESFVGKQDAIVTFAGVGKNYRLRATVKAFTKKKVEPARISADRSK